MKKQIKTPLSKVYINEEIKRKVSLVLDGGRYILGKECKTFEEEFAGYCGTKYACLVGSGTTAIWLSLLSLGIKPGDEICVPSHTAFPTIEPIIHLGAKPVFIDVDETYTIDTKKIEERISNRTKAIVPVHLYGHSANMREIMSLARRHKLFVVEDCAQAHGAKFKEKRVGAIGDAGCFSFYPSKNLTVCGDGGAVVTNNKAIVEKIKQLRNHGRRSKYVHEVTGFNERFNDVQAAIGRVQLKKLNSFNSRRRAIAGTYRSRLKTLPLALPPEMDWTYHVYHMFVIKLKSRDKLADHLLKSGIETGIHYPVPCHLQPATIRRFKGVNLPVTEALCEEILSLPMHPLLTDSQAHQVCRKIGNFFNYER